MPNDHKTGNQNNYTRLNMVGPVSDRTCGGSATAGYLRRYDECPYIKS